MARKNNMKSDNPTSIHFDTRTKAVMAEVNSEDKVNIKEKVTAVREVVPGKSTNEIVLVLQYYDYNVERAIQAYLEDGAKEALTEWHFTGNKPSNKKKKNKKSKASASQSGPPTSLSSSSDKKDAIPNHTKEPITNGDLHEDEELLRVRARLLDGDNFQITGASEVAVAAESIPAPVSVPPVTTAPDVDRGKSPAGAEAQLTQHQNKHQNRHSDKHSGAHHHGHQHAHQRQRTSSERSTSSIGSSGVKKPFAGLEKSTKDLQRQTISLERLRLGLDAEIEKAYKRVKAVFEEARNSLIDREVQLIRDVDALKVQANSVFRMRQEKAAELKVRVERAEKLNDAELAELRADIKLFVSDRKIDEDLCKTTRFTYDSDHLLEEVRNFGTVVPVKCSYSTRRPSVSSVASSGHGQDEPLSPGIRQLNTQQPMHTDGDSVAATTDNNLSMKEMAELQQRLKNSLQLQGLSVKSPPPRNRPVSAPAQKPDGENEEEFKRNRQGRRKRGQKETPENTDSPNENQTNAPQPAQSHASQGTSPEKSDGPNTGSRSPRRNYSGNQSSPRRYGSGGGQGRGSRGRGGDGYPDDSRYRGDDRRPRGRGEGRGRGRDYRGKDSRGRDGRGRGGSNSAPRPNAQSSQGGSTSSSGNPAVVNGPTNSSGN